MSEEKTFIIKVTTETCLEAWVSDLSSFVLAVALIGLGVYLESNAMQWVGAIIFFLVCSAKGSGKIKRFKPDEAIKFIEGLK